MPCEERVGFLILHACGGSAAAQCEFCKKKLCDKHIVTVEVPGSQSTDPSAAPVTHSGVSCPTCVREGRVPGMGPRQQQQQQQQGYQQPYQNYYWGGYYPYSLHDYDSRDRAVFDRDTAAAGAAGADALSS